MNFLRRLAVLCHVELDDGFNADTDARVLNLLKFAELRVNGGKGKAVRLPKGTKYSTVFQEIAWVCVNFFHRS